MSRALAFALVFSAAGPLAALVYEEDFEFLRGDADNNGIVNVSDVQFLLQHHYFGGPAPECADTADVDDSSVIDNADALALLDWIYLGGPQPAAPGPAACGPDRTLDNLGCARPYCAAAPAAPASSAFLEAKTPSRTAGPSLAPR